MRWYQGLLPVVIGLCAGDAASPPVRAGEAIAPPNVVVDLSFGRHAAAEGLGRVLVDFGGLSIDAFAQVIIATGHLEPRISPPAVDDWVLRLRRRLHRPEPDGRDVAALAQPDSVSALALDRNSLIGNTDPQWTSWLAAAERFWSLIIAGVWLLATFVLFAVLQGMFRGKPTLEKPVRRANAPMRPNRPG